MSAAAAVPCRVSPVPAVPVPPGTRDRLKSLGPWNFVEWMLSKPGVLLTDTSLGDAARIHGVRAVAPHYARLAPQLFSLECRGGAASGGARRGPEGDVWIRLRQLRAAIPGILFQMPLCGPDRVGGAVRRVVVQAVENGVDLFRVSDPSNRIGGMRAAMEAAVDGGALCEGVLRYGADVRDGGLGYWAGLARQLEQAGAHVVGIEDAAGTACPRAIGALVRALKGEVGLPLRFRARSAGDIASVLAAVEAGCDVVDGVLEAAGGPASPPGLGSIVQALRGSGRDPQIDGAVLRTLRRP
ncbi:hypothetical protein [Pseudothauera rhizosphaerae]|uniref:Pyruvate carboxyltransferase domain-containing protein n=1 Tax=Pseudothauera rhizosphaerae TaxID=2565932 RepID=A0A4S4ALY7_9RHOO|nr:hypothetical protein [Pseudothauera rhizosphaerae]THF60532.1 hypothetical protein E6O51_13760 [Pseudothauera rhizosphaerae]